MRRSEKQLASKANFSTFCSLVAPILGQSCVRELRVTKIVNEIKFEGVRGELEAKNCFLTHSAKFSLTFCVFINSCNC